MTSLSHGSPKPLPDGSLLLHIGPQKTGSTAIQGAMHVRRDELANHGVLYPGHQQREREGGWAVMGIGSAVGRRPPRIARWEALADEVRRSDASRICVSNEDFARAEPAAVERILAGLDPERVHLLYVARRLDRLLPSQWQERVKARLTTSFEEYLRIVLEGPADHPLARLTWGPQDAAAVVARWAEHLPVERIAVLVSDEHDHGVIPRAFESLLGLPGGLLDPIPERSNRSLGYLECEVVRRLNQVAADDGWTPQQYWRLIQSGAVEELKRNPVDGPRIAGLPGWALDAVAVRADAQVEAIAASGARVLGDLDNLRVAGRVEPADLPPAIEDVPVEVVPAITRGLVAGTETLHSQERREAVRAAASSGGPALAEAGGRELLRALARRVRARF